MIQPLVDPFAYNLGVNLTCNRAFFWGSVERCEVGREGKKGKKDNLIAGWGIYLFIIHCKGFPSRKYKAALTNNHDKTRGS